MSEGITLYLPIVPEETPAGQAYKLFSGILQRDFRLVDEIKDYDKAAFRHVLEVNVRKVSVDALCEAAAIGCLPVVKLLVEVGGLSPVELPGGNKPGTAPDAACVAAFKGQLEVLKYFIEERGVSPKHTFSATDDKYPLIHTATLTGGKDNTLMLAYLLSKGASVHDKSSAGRTPLYLSIEAKGVGCETNELFLIERGADVRVSTVRKQEHLSTHILGLACTIGRSDRFLQALLDNGARADINKKLGDGTPPLTAAIFQGKEGPVKFLLKNGADLSLVRPADEVSALYAAVATGRFEICRIILELPEGKALIDKADKAGSTPLMMAMERKDAKMVRLLLENGADPHKQSRQVSYTAMTFAILNGSLDCMKLLADAGADLEATFPHLEHRNFRPIHLAVARGFIAGVKWLAEVKKVDIMAMTSAGVRADQLPFIAPSRGAAATAADRSAQDACKQYLRGLIKERESAQTRARAGASEQVPAGVPPVPADPSPSPSEAPAGDSACRVCGAGGKMKKCGVCRAAGIDVPYCSEACQKADWKQHKLVCASRNKK